MIMHRITSYYQQSTVPGTGPGASRKSMDRPRPATAPSACIPSASPGDRHRPRRPAPAQASPGGRQRSGPAPRTVPASRQPARSGIAPGGGGTRRGTRGAESCQGLRRARAGSVFEHPLGDITSRGGNFLALIPAPWRGSRIEQWPV